MANANLNGNRFWVAFFLIIGFLGALLFDIGNYQTTSVTMMCVGFSLTVVIGVTSYLNGTL